jgi:hypothetical protein
MSNSLPSPYVGLVDVPEVKEFHANFVYDFFTPDESLNDGNSYSRQPSVPENIRRLPAESFDAERIEKMMKIVPRFVRFDFATSISQQNNAQGNEFLNTKSFDRKHLSIAENIQKIQSEEEFSGKAFTSFEFQDTNIDSKLFTILSGSIAKRVAARNRNIQQQIDENRKTIIDNLTDEHSLLDAARALAEDTSEDVSNDMIVSALASLDALKLTFIDDKTQRELTDSAFEQVRKVAVRAQISNRLVGSIVSNIVNDPMNQFSDEFSLLKQRAIAKQKEAISSTNTQQIKASEYETNFNAITRCPYNYTWLSSQPDQIAYNDTRVIGYIIEKTELSPDNKLKKHRPIIVENALATTAVDLNVAYGRTYIYTIRSVAQVQVNAYDDENSEVLIARGLVQSRRSPRVFVKCVENIPPPPVADFNIVWDYSQKVPVLLWNFPTNPQRDIKRFQIFKRSSITEPFSLIKELDFDDSELKYSSGENVLPELVEKLKHPITSFTDRQFSKHSTAIYTVCCIDAHGLSSNYSLQMQISFDSFKNRLRKQLVSYAGAPKPYPNMSLLHDTFVDTMKVSGHTRVKVVFDPEFLDVFDIGGNDLNLLATNKHDTNAKYQLQFINTDVQRQEIVSIKIKDLRRKKTTKPAQKQNTGQNVKP